MGGKAFSHGSNPLSTPRIPKAIYTLLRDEYVNILSRLYSSVASPLDAPGKDLYGDIDILVSNPLRQLTTQALANALNAKASVTTPGSPTTSFAVTYPGSEDDYVQVDVHECTSKNFQWELFTASHGDLWNIIGTSIRVFGLTANNVGLYLRIQAIEDFDRKRSMVFLTSSPDSVLEFLGLDVESYWKPFATVEELFLYAASMRLFKRERYVREILKANDRKRIAQRPLYRLFVDEWLPKRADLGSEGRELIATRQTVMDEALERYGKRREYEEMLQVWCEERAELNAKQWAKDSRRADAKREIEYAEAWIEASKHVLKKGDCL